MKTFILFLLLGISVFVASSCQHNYYAPNAHNVPLFQHKYEARLSGLQTEGDYAKGYEVQGAFAITNHIGITGGYFEAATNDKKNYGFYSEAGAGYYYPFLQHYVIECYGGVGKDHVHNNFELGRFINNSFYKYYIQPSFGVTSTYIDAIVSIRIAQLNLFGINYWQINDPQNSQYSTELDHDYRTLLNAKQSYLYEPCVTMRVG